MFSTTLRCGFLLFLSIVLLISNTNSDEGFEKTVVSRINEVINFFESKLNVKKELMEVLNKPIFSKFEEYDFILDVRRLDDLKEGWDLIFRSDILLKYWTSKTDSPAVWGISGSKFNVGKTWVTGQILEKRYAEGYSEAGITRGLSFIHHKTGNGAVIVVDSMGKDRPLYDVNVHQRVTMDDFVTEFLQTMSKVYLYVVPTLGASDIEDTNKIIAKTFSKSTSMTEIIIVHNFRELSDPKDVKFHIDQDIVQAFAYDTDMSEDECKEKKEHFNMEYVIEIQSMGIAKGREPEYIASEKKCRSYPVEVSRGVWKNNGHKDDNFKMRLYHVVFVNANSELASIHNANSLAFLQAKLQADALATKPFPFLETLKYTARSIVYNHLYTPDESKDYIPIALNIAEVQYDPHGLKSYLYKSLQDIVNVFDSMFSQAKAAFSGLWSFAFGDANPQKKIEDPFSLITQPKPASDNTLRLKFQQDLSANSLVYAPLDSHYAVDKYYEPKIDILTSETSTIYIFEMPGVPKGSVTVSCFIGNTFFRVYGMKPIPKIYSRYIKNSKSIIENERRFSSFSLSINFGINHVCINPVPFEMENGVLFVTLPKIADAITGNPHSVIFPEKDEL